MLPAVLLVALWLLDAHEPAGWADAATPWFSHLRAVWPTTWALDRLDTALVPASDVPVGSFVVLLAAVMCSLMTMLWIGVPAVLAVAVAAGLAATRSLWSTVAPGQDAVPIAVVAGAILALTWPRRASRAGWVAAGAALLSSPASTWLLLPALCAQQSTARRRWLAGIALVVLAGALQLCALHVAWTQVQCLAHGDWRSAIGEVLRPGASADASAWVAIRQASTVLVGDVHLFGLAVAALGLARATPRARALRTPTLVAIASAVIAVAAGALPPAFAAALLLPWWAPWFATGLAALVDLAAGRSRRLAVTFALLMAALLPLLRHANVAPAPWRAGMPATATAVAGAWQHGAVAIQDAAWARRLRLAGATTVPADARTLATCVASGRDVFALGPMIRRVQQLGYRVTERSLRAPLAAVLRDVRDDQLVALAFAPGARGWAGSAGLAALARVGVTRDTPATLAVAVLARTDQAADVRTGRAEIAADWRQGDVLARHQLLVPVSMSARQGDVVVDSAPFRLATGSVAAVAVFDRTHDAVLKGVAEPSAGLPIALTRHAEWSNVVVRGTPHCVAASTNWTALPATMSRLAVPVTGAGPGRPAVVLLGADARPQITIDGLAIDPMWDASPVTLYDRQSPADLQHLQQSLQRADIPSGQALPGRWVARIELRPRGVWNAPRALVTPGVAAAGWLVRLSAVGSRPDNAQVCDVVGGERVLAGQDGTVDEETPREIAVTTRDGWHAPEHSRRAVHQWSARPAATIGFHLDTPLSLVLAMDAWGAATTNGRQPLAVRVNGRLITADWPGEARLPVPIDATHAGENTLELSVEAVVQPPGDARPLGVLLRRLRLIQANGS